MFPLRDVNPTTRTPLLTMLLIAACVATWLFWQQEPARSANEDLIFNIEHAAIPCELTEGRPLTLDELNATFGPGPGDDAACGVTDGRGPAGVPDKSVWLAVLASLFMHGGPVHIGGNMLYLWIFGNNIEDHLGPIRFAAFYLLGGLVATATHVALQPTSTVPVVGASGAVAAVMGAYLVWFPRAPVRTVIVLGFPIITTVQAKWLLGVWFLMQFFTSPNAGVAWAAHVGGFAFGVVVGVLVRTFRPAQRVAWRSAARSQMSPRHWDPTGGAGAGAEYRRWRS